MDIILPRGLRNHNPLNIRKSSAAWQGLAKVQSDKAFCVFVSNEYGYRAAFKQLKTYMVRDGKCNIHDWISTWAPPTENYTRNYIRQVCAMTGIPEYKKLWWTDRESMVAVVNAMALVENGTKYIDFVKESEIREGYRLAFE